MLFHRCFLLMQALWTVTATDDYWSSDFDSSKNCESQEEVSKLQAGANQCNSVGVKNNGEEAAFHVCVNTLNQLLGKMCEKTKVDDPGKLLYCKSRGQINCCFKDAKCASWLSMNNKIFVKAKDFLENTTSFINLQVKEMGYKTCHRLDSLDATKCAKDCEEQKKSKFAKDCRKKEGLFKCCIRRDKVFCHECRFCCTLPMCVVDPGGEEGTTFEGAKLELKDQINKKSAADLYFSQYHRYKKEDYYCLKPFSHNNPKRWNQYDMEKYRKAYTKEALENVPVYKFDNRLNNFVDPKVHKVFTKTEKSSYQSWKETYNLWVRRIPPYHDAKKNAFIDYDINVCLKRCLKMERSKFGKRCKRNKGYFKCCLSNFRLDPFENARNDLIDAGFIKVKKSKNCKITKSGKSTCQFCTMTGWCSQKDVMTGKVMNTFYPGNKTWKKGNWSYSTQLLRTEWCKVLDICKGSNLEFRFNLLSTTF